MSESNEFRVLNDRKRKTSTRVASVVFGIALVAIGILLSSPIGILLGPLLVWAAFFNKYTIVNPEGIIVYYDAVLFKYKEAWLFDDVSNLHRETVKDPNYIVLHFTRRSLSKRLIFQKQDAQKIIDLALRKNNKIHFEEVD